MFISPEEPPPTSAPSMSSFAIRAAVLPGSGYEYAHHHTDGG
jgi:hypothetical protein